MSQSRIALIVPLPPAEAQGVANTLQRLLKVLTPTELERCTTALEKPLVKAMVLQKLKQHS